MGSNLRAVFLDRDGVINANKDEYVKSVEELIFLHGACEAIARLTRQDIPVFVVSNQSCVGRGLLDLGVLNEITDHLLYCVRTAGGDIARVYYCPHRPEEGCECRKPRAGLLRRAEGEWGVNLSRSFLVGDAQTDIVAGRTVGCRTAMVLTGRGSIELNLCHQRDTLPHHVASGLPAAVDWVLKELRAPGDLR